MILKKGSLADFARRVKASGKGIIVYGAGVIGQTAAPYWLREYGLEEAVLCYADADPGKQGRNVPLSSRGVPTMGPSVLEERRGAYLLLITVSAFEPVVKALDAVPGTEGAEAYFLPVMLADMAHEPKEGGAVRAGQEPLIPKKIHYCWFSGKPIPEKLRGCIDSWRRFCPDYEIIRWDESSYDIDRYPYMRQAYQHQKWGFVPDIARLDILFRHGGIYLDTDVELLRSLDELLFQPAFCGVEKWGTVNTGGCSGAQPGNPVVKRMLDYRKDASFVQEDGSLNLTTCGYYETRSLIPCGFQVNGQTQVLADGQITVYASEFFHPFDYMSGETRVTKNTFSVHHFSGTWLGPDAAREREKTRGRYERFLAELEAVEAV